MSAEAGEEERNKLSLFLSGKNIGGFFNFQERTHENIVFQSLDFVEEKRLLDWLTIPLF